MIQTWGIFEPNQNNSKGYEIWQRGWGHGREFIGKEWTLIEKGKVALAEGRTRRKGEGDDAWDKGMGIILQVCWGEFQNKGIFNIAP